MDKKIIVLKPTGTVQIANKFSLIERKLINGIIWHSQRNRFESQEYSLPIAQVFQIVGLESSRNYDIVKDALRALTGTIIEWNFFGEDKNQEWGVCTFLSTGKITRGKVKYRLNPEIVDKVRHPVLFAKIQLLIQSQFKKRHALVLYEFFVDLLSRQKVEKIVIQEVSLEKLQKLLGTDGAKFMEQGNYKFFNRDVLKPSINEINNHSDIVVTYEPIREQRKVAAFTFTVERKPSYSLFLELMEADKATSQSAPPQPDDDALLERLTDKGVSLRKAQQLIETYDERQIADNLELVSQQQKKGRIKNLPAYLVKAIEEDYRHKKSPEEFQEEKTQAARQAAEDARRTREELEQEWECFCTNRLKDNFLKMPLGWQEEKRRKFIEKIKQEASQGNSFLYRRFQKEKFSSPFVEANFLDGLKSELLVRPEETSLEHYIAWRALPEQRT